MNWSEANRLTRSGELWGYIDLNENFTHDTLEKYNIYKLNLRFSKIIHFYQIFKDLIHLIPKTRHTLEATCNSILYIQILIVLIKNLKKSYFY